MFESYELVFCGCHSHRSHAHKQCAHVLQHAQPEQPTEEVLEAPLTNYLETQKNVRSTETGGVHQGEDDKSGFFPQLLWQISQLTSKAS